MTFSQTIICFNYIYNSCSLSNDSFERPPIKFFRLCCFLFSRDVPVRVCKVKLQSIFSAAKSKWGVVLVFSIGLKLGYTYYIYIFQLNCKIVFEIPSAGQHPWYKITYINILWLQLLCISFRAEELPHACTSGREIQCIGSRCKSSFVECHLLALHRRLSISYCRTNLLNATYLSTKLSYDITSKLELLLLYQGFVSGSTNCVKHTSKGDTVTSA